MNPDSDHPLLDWPKRTVDLQQHDAAGGLAYRVWKKKVVAFVREWLNRNAWITPDDVRAWAEQHPTRQPAEQQWWGVLWAYLRTLGLEPTGETFTSRTKSRNAARAQVWKPTDRWGRGS